METFHRLRIRSFCLFMRFTVCVNKSHEIFISISNYRIHTCVNPYCRVLIACCNNCNTIPFNIRYFLSRICRVMALAIICWFDFVTRITASCTAIFVFVLYTLPNKHQTLKYSLEIFNILYNKYAPNILFIAIN